MSFSALCRINVTIPCTELVRRRQHSLIQENLLYPNIQSISPRRWPSFQLSLMRLLRGLILTIEESLGADILETLLEDLDAVEEGVERVNVWLYGLRERGIGCVVFGRISEEIIAAEGIIFDGPIGRGVVGRGSHCMLFAPGAKRATTQGKQQSKLLLM